MSDVQAGSKRIAYLDVARSIAIVSITFNHAVNRSFATVIGQYAEFTSIPFALTVVKAILYAFSRLGVPIFLMISGALLLTRDYSGERLGKFLKHNWLQLLIVTEIWLTIMFWYLQLSPSSVLRTQGIVACLIRFVMTLLFLNPISMGSMWYMYMILCVYLLIPILATALRTLDHKYFLIPMAIVTFCSFILPDVNGALVASGVLKEGGTFVTALDSSSVFSMFVVYLLLGYFVSQGALEPLTTTTLRIVVAVAFVAFCAVQVWGYSCTYDYVVANGYEGIFPMLVVVPLFELLRRRSIDADSRLARTAKELSIISFGIYFVHICIMEGLVAVIGRFGWDITYLGKFLVLEIVSFVGAALIVDVCRKSKVLGTYLFGIK